MYEENSYKNVDNQASSAKQLNRSSVSNQDSNRNSELLSKNDNQSKTKKVNIKKLIELKQARTQKPIVNEPAPPPPPTYFQKTSHPSIQTCLLCGYMIFTLTPESVPSEKQHHIQTSHPQLLNPPQIPSSLPALSPNSLPIPKFEQLIPSILPSSQDTDSQNSAKQLVEFVRDPRNQSEVEYILGQKFGAMFQPYVEKREGDCQKWGQLVERVFRIYL